MHWLRPERLGGAANRFGAGIEPHLELVLSKDDRHRLRVNRVEQRIGFTCQECIDTAVIDRTPEACERNDLAARLVEPGEHRLPLHMARRRLFGKARRGYGTAE
mgnify:CR=1 FL=1